jgi:hypothetical protein
MTMSFPTQMSVMTQISIMTLVDFDTFVEYTRHLSTFVVYSTFVFYSVVDKTIWVGRLGSIPYRFAFFATVKGADVKSLTDNGPRR